MSDDDTVIKCRVVWGLAGSLRIEPLVIVSYERDQFFEYRERELLEEIAEICGRRQPKPSEVSLLGGNCEPGVLVRANEAHFKTDKAPRFVSWLCKKIAAEIENGDRYKFEVIYREGKG